MAKDSLLFRPLLLFLYAMYRNKEGKREKISIYVKEPDSSLIFVSIYMFLPSLLSLSFSLSFFRVYLYVMDKFLFMERQTRRAGGRKKIRKIPSSSESSIFVLYYIEKGVPNSGDFFFVFF